jgi:outer membrane protein OmpA-like peptidoglycan-associated protein
MADVSVALGDDMSAINAYEKGLELEDGNKRALKKLDVLRIKHKARMGDMVTSEEVVTVMTTEDAQPYTKQSADGPLLSMQIPYERSSPALTETAKSLLDIVGWALRDVSLQGASFEVAGHTDSTGSKEGNLLLSKRRAEVVKEYLVQMHQVDASRLRVAGFGDSKPLAPNTTEANRAMNRRVDFRKINPQ